jgi:hypothetical protein
MRSSLSSIIFIVLAGLFSIGVFTILFMKYRETNTSGSLQSETITAQFINAPTTADPYRYDHFANHAGFTSVFSRLITNYSKGKFTGVLAESWTSENQMKTWHFNLRKNVRFENGDPISSEIIVQNLLRIALKTREFGSKLDFFDSLVGFEKFRTSGDKIEGIKFDVNSITFDFVKPMPELLQTLSFGLYSVLHPSNFDEKTGEFIPAEKILSSGRYKISSWTEQELLLELRKDFLREVYPENNAKKVRLVWKDQETLPDLIYGLADRSVGKGFAFYGPVPSAIQYVQCMNWWVPSSPCSSIENRIHLRNAFYEALSKHGFAITRSFFPPSMANIKEPDDYSGKTPNVPPKLPSSMKVGVRPMAYMINPKFDEFVKHWSAAASIELINEGIVPLKTVRQVNRNDISPVDLAIRMTGILVHNPDSDIRFMINSKEGICLPDIDGEIGKLVAGANKIDTQKVNQMIFDQAVVWPVAHFADGIWANDKINMDSYNSLLPVYDFSWIGIK